MPQPPLPDLLNRLEAALAALAPRLSQELVTVWRDCANRYGQEHPAAVGCLIALAREAWAGVEEPSDPELGSKPRQVIGPLVTVFMTPQGWTVGIPATAPGRAWCRLGRGRTVLEALILALEGAAVKAER